MAALLRYLGSLLLLLQRSTLLLLRRSVPRRAILLQAYEAGNRSVVFVAATMGFMGMIMVIQACYEAQRLVGDYALVGPGFLELLVREFAPTIGALMIATRVGAGIAAELGSMAVTEQLDALEMCGADPVAELVAPRVAASALMLPALVVLGGAAAEGAGLFAARVAFQVPPEQFWNTRLLTGGDAVVGLIKAATYGAAIPVISARAGLLARGGSTGVGNATTRAVIESSLAIIILDFTLNLALYPLYQRAA